MTHFTLIEGGDPVGYVDTETLEYEYNGDDGLVETALQRLGMSLGMSENDLYGETVRLEGKEAEAYIRSMAEDEMTDVDVKERD